METLYVKKKFSITNGQKMPIKMTVRYHVTPVLMSVMKKTRDETPCALLGDVYIAASVCLSTGSEIIVSKSICTPCLLLHF